MASQEKHQLYELVKTKLFARDDGTVVLSVWMRDPQGQMRIRMAHVARDEVKSHLNYLAAFGEWPNENGELSHNGAGLPF
jgi:hypothetical protein